VAFSPDGTTVAASPDAVEVGTVWLWDRATGELVSTISYESGWPPNRMRFSPDGRFLLIGEWSSSTGWCEVATGRCIPRPSKYGPATLSDDGSTIASGSGDRETPVVLASTTTHDQISEIPGRSSWSSGWLRDLAFSPDGAVLAGAADSGWGGSVVWDVATGREIYSMSTEDRCVAFNPDGTIIAFGDIDSVLLLPVHITANR
jgi:WD40 repeat protein